MEPDDMESMCESVQVRLTLGEPLPEDLAAHLASCSECRQASNVSRLLHGALGKTADWKPGDRVLDQYQVIDRLGEGGQGTVFKARDLDNRGLTVALKVVQQDSGEEFINAIGITHPNVCRIYHAKTVGPFRVIVMEYVGGGTLADRLAAGPLRRDEALVLFRGICDGVRAAHAANVRHLDLKPSNVLIRDGVVPVVSDFGLAAISGAGARGGTSGYMAPEQARGEPVDQRADVFALGVLLADLVPAPPPRLRAVIERARDPLVANRTANVGELLRQLDRAGRGGLSVAVSVGAAVVLAAVAVGGARAYLRATPSRGAEPIASSNSPPGAAPDRAAPPPVPVAVASAQPEPPPSTLVPTAPEQKTASASSASRGTKRLLAAAGAPEATPASPVSDAAAGPTAAAVASAETCASNDFPECKRLCDLDDAASCHNAGRYVLRILSDPATAAKYLKRGCDGNFGAACADLGVIYQEGHGVPKDAGHAAALYQRACGLGEAQGCNNLGGLYGNGEGIAQDLPRAMKLFEKACSGGASSACGNLGLAYSEGNGVTKDAARGKELLKRACRADTSWCDAYRKAAAP